MRIGFDASPIVGQRGGVGWHAYYLLRALVNLKEDLNLIAYVPPGSLKAGAVPDWGHASGFRWVEAGNLMMPWRGRLDRLDLFHGTNFKMRTVGRVGGLVTVYDLWLDRAPQYSRKLFGQRGSHYRTRRTARRARRVFTISEHSAREIESLYGLSRDRIVVIPCGVSEEFQPNPDRRALAELLRRLPVPTERFILFVGGADPRKNHRTFLQAFARCAGKLPDHSVVLVGEQHHRFGDMRETVHALGLDRRVVCAGLVPMADLRLLYTHADLFVFPSLYEGFGMPVLEAMACGAPVITSNNTALPEVAGDAAVLVKPEDTDELAGAMVRVLEDAALRAQLRARGSERVKQFTWERAAHQTMAVYRELCSTKLSYSIGWTERML